MTKIHPTAVVEDGAQIAASAEIGPFCWISSKAKIGENVRLMPSWLSVSAMLFAKT